MLTHKQLRAKALGHANVKAEYEKLSDEYVLLDEFLKARADQGLTQAQVQELDDEASSEATLYRPSLYLERARQSMKTRPKPQHPNRWTL
jgi:hypothetical protein